MTTKIHAVVDRRGLPIRLSLTAGQAHDLVPAGALLSGLGKGDIVLADKAYDANWLRDHIESQLAVFNVPNKSRRLKPNPFDPVLYKDRNLVERFFNKIKYFRRIATRYDKLADTFMAMVKLASIRIWLRFYESTA